MQILIHTSLATLDQCPNQYCNQTSSRLPKKFIPMNTTLIRKFAITIGAIIAFSFHEAHADEAALKAQIEALQQQLNTLQEQVSLLRAQAGPPDQSGKKTSVSSPATEVARTAVDQDTTVGGYGEITYTGYRTNSSRNQADLRRIVLLVGHHFSDRLIFNSEIEWEHAVTSADDAGESEIEQAFLDYHLAAGPTIRAGLFLMPLGLLNENHEPPVFYGVNRNEVETRIIPTTWREGGVGIHDTTRSGLEYNIGLTTGFDLTKFGDSSAPLASSHQELQLARAHDLALYGSLNYRGVPGLTLGAGLFTGNSTQDNAAFKADPATPDFGTAKGRVTLWDIHGRWQPGRWDFAALYSAGTIGDAGQMDAALLNFNKANGGSWPYLPSRFEGWYVQAARKVWENGDLSLSPFMRFEFFDTQATMPQGFDRDPTNRDHVLTAGFSFRVHPQVVIKADYQKYKENTLNDRYNLGLGFMY